MKLFNRVRPDHENTHDALVALKREIDQSHRHRHWFSEKEILNKAQQLGLVLLSHEPRGKAMNVEFGLLATKELSEEAFFHVCFTILPTSGLSHAVATYMTIYTNPIARGGWPIDQITGEIQCPHPFPDLLEDACHG